MGPISSGWASYASVSLSRLSNNNASVLNYINRISAFLYLVSTIEGLGATKKGVEGKLLIFEETF